jgi:hypothetical protein
MSEMKCGAKRFGESICRINDTQDMAKGILPLAFHSWIASKMLNVNVLRTWRWSA